MSSGGVTVDGLATLVRTLDAAGEELGDFTEPHREATGLIGARASSLAPRRSGALAAGHRTDARAGVGSVYNTRDYAAPIHWGWPRRGIRAQPWLSDAATRTESEWIDAYRKHVQGVLDTVKGD